MASPLEIKIALHYWTNSTEDYAADDERHRTSPAVVSAVDSMVKAGLLEYPRKVPGKVEVGPALETYVAALMAVPFPVQQWVIPERDKRTDSTKAVNEVWEGPFDHVPSGIWSRPCNVMKNPLDEHGFVTDVKSSTGKPKTPTA